MHPQLALLQVTGRAGGERSGRRVREEVRWREGACHRTGREEGELEQELEGSSSEDEGLGSSPPLSPEKPLSPPGTLERGSSQQLDESSHSSFSGLVTPPRSNRDPPLPASILTSLTSCGMVTPPRLSKIPTTHVSTLGQPNTARPRKLSPPSHKSSPRVFSPLNFGSLSQPGNTSPPLKRVLRLRRVEGLSMGKQLR